MGKIALGGFDHSTMADAFSGPNNDTRQHITFALVAKGDEQNPSVEFDDEDGQIYVTVVTQPTRLYVRARVAAGVAGNGEGEYFPFLENDEVIVAIPDGDERAGATIIGRMNNGYDKFPQSVSGQDVTKNNFAFRRIRTPYILETASTYMVRSAISGSFWSIDSSGSLTFSDGNSNMLHVGADFIGLASGDNKVLAQLDLHENQFVVEADGTKMVLDANDSYITTLGTLKLITSGSTPAFHVTTVESVVVLLQQVLIALGTAAGIAGGTIAPLAGVLNSAGVLALLNASIPLAAAASVTAFAPAISAGLAVPSDAAGAKPGIARPGLVV